MLKPINYLSNGKLKLFYNQKGNQYLKNKRFTAKLEKKKKLIKNKENHKEKKKKNRVNQPSVMS